MERTFQGERLRQARVVRGMTAVALAERVGVKPQAISQYERKSQTPRSEVQARICEALRLPEAFFYKPPLEPESAIPRFRSIASTTKRARESAQEYLEWLREMVETFVDRLVELPKPNLPRFDVPPDPTRLSFENIDAFAAQLRKEWNLGHGPIPNLTKPLEVRGVVLTRFAFGSAEVDAFSVNAKSRPFIVLNSEKDSCTRSRFDAAHELGHILLHAAAPSRPSRDLYRLMEQQAHRFSSAFLFPEDSFLDEVMSIHPDSLLSLKRRWLVSVSMMLYRAGQLRLGSESQIENAWRLYTRRGWKRREPLDDDISIEQPAMLRMAMRVLSEQCGIGRTEIQRYVRLDVGDLALFTALPVEYFTSDTWGEVQTLRKRVAETHEASPTTDGTVVDFPRRT